ncbi:SCO7613 C-terminal domain-containing membrane protein [Streptosporangium sp. NPDC004631]
MDRALADLRVREADLLTRRDHLLGLLRADRARSAQDALRSPAAGEGRGNPPSPPPPRHTAEPPPRKDFSPKAAQNLLLGLGGLLLVVAAVVFTVVSWGHIGIGGRAVILAGVTVLTLATPGLLVRRGLTATAETIAMFGVALLFLDGYAARRVGLAGADGLSPLDYAALLFGLVALVMAGYSRLLPLRLPLPVAIVLAQFPLPLLTLGKTAPWVTAALTVTAAADAALLMLGAGAKRGAAPGVPATVRGCFGVTWALGAACGVLDSALRLGDFSQVEGPAVTLVKGVLLVAAAGLGVVVAPRLRTPGLELLAAGSAFTLVAGVAAPVWPLLPPGWQVVPYTAGALITVAAARYLPGLNDPRVRSSGAVSAGCLAVLTAVPSAPAVINTLLAPFTRLDDVWAGPYVLTGDWRIVPLPSTPIVLGLLALTSARAAWRRSARPEPVEPGSVKPEPAEEGPIERAPAGQGPVRRRPTPMGLFALVTGTVATAVAPVALAWGHPANLAVLLALTAVLVACLTLTGNPRWARALTVAAVPVASVAAATATADRTGTYLALAVLLVAWGAATFTARVPEVAATALVVAVLSATGLIWAVTTGIGWQPVSDGLSLALAVGAVLAALLHLHRSRPQAGTAPDETPQPERRSGPTADGVSDPRRRAGVVLSVVLAASAVPPIHDALAGILGFYGPLAHPWSAPAAPHARYPLLIVIAVLVAVAAVTASWRLAGRRGAFGAGLVAWPVVSAALPVSVGLPYGLEVGLFVAALGPSAWMAARSRTNWVFGAAAALATVSLALSWALASRSATLVALPSVAVIAAATAFRGRERAVRAGGAALAVLLAGAEALSAGIALEWPVRHAAFAVLAVACAATAVAGGFRRSSFAVGVEGAGYTLAVVGLALAADGLPLASLACATVGVLMAGTALRPDRRWAGYVGTGLLLTASWLRLLASDITVVEAYTVPFSLVLLAFGWWRARGRAVSSWAAYGTGLASSLLPSTIAMLVGTGWVRPLLLGVVCLAVLSAGARLRLQAPALLGGLTLTVVALHELAPWIAQVVMAVPRWVPMAAGGVLLVVLGATYEARLRDVRRLRAAVLRMR